MIEFGILGPLVVRADVGEVRVVGARRRALLVRLVASAGQAVPAERLAEDLWEGSPPAGAKSTLASHVSLLRGLLGSDRIWSRDGGYVLKATDSEVDARSFESEAQRGRDALLKAEFQAAAVLLGHALQRWRGGALDDVAGTVWALPDVTRLEALRLSTFEAWIDARLALGEHAEVVPVLEAAATEHPLRERVSAQLMLALYRAGRQADALRTYRALESLLGEELGIVPSAEVTALEEAIVLQDPALAAGSVELPPAGVFAPSAPVHPRGDAAGDDGREGSEPLADRPGDQGSDPALRSDLRWLPAPSDPAFVGRAEQVEQVRAEWRETQFRPRLVVLEGSAGVGKTRLLAEVATRIDAEGGMVLFGRCDEEATRPCQPFGEVLDYLASALSDEDFYALVSPYADGLSYLSRPVARRLRIEQPHLAPQTAESDRYRLLEAITSLLAGIGALRALFLVLDDLQWADPLSLVVVRHLLSRLDPTPVTLAATARDEAPDYRRTIAGLMTSLDRDIAPVRMTIPGLPFHDSQQLFQHHDPGPAATDLMADVWRVTQGNPFFVLQVARQIAEERRAPDEPGDPSGVAGYRVPQRVQELIDLRIAKLTGDAVVFMTAGSVFGEHFALDDVAGLCGMDQARALAAADELLEARLVLAREDDTYRFDHGLVRRAVYDSLAPGRRLRLHRQAGTILASHETGLAKAPFGEIAYHFTQAAPLGPDDVRTAASWARKAGDREFAQLAFESAARSYESALGLIAQFPEPTPGLAAELSLLLGRSLNGAGETERGKEALRRAFDFGSQAGRSDLKALAALDYGGSLPLATNVDDAHPAQMLAETLDDLGEDSASTKARCLSRLALWQYRSGPRGERQRLCDEALSLARASVDAGVLAAVLYDRSWALFGPDGCRDQLGAGDEMVAMGDALDDPTLVLHGQQCRLHALLELGPAEEARSTGDEVARLARELRDPAHVWSSMAYRALCATNEGRFLEAEELAETALRLHRPSDQVQAFVAYGTQRFQRHLLQGRLGEDRETLLGIIRRSPDRLSMVAALLWTEVEGGEVARARDVLAQIAAVGWNTIPKDLEWWPIMASAATAAHALADRPIADELYQQLVEYRDHNCVSAGVAFFGNAEHYLGLLAEIMGETDRARQHLETAIVGYDEWGAFPFGALCRRDLGRLMVSAGEDGDGEGRRLLGRSLLDANRLGMAGLLDNIRDNEGVASVAG